MSPNLTFAKIPDEIDRDRKGETLLDLIGDNRTPNKGGMHVPHIFIAKRMLQKSPLPLGQA
jgi:hypothetical protein